MRNKLLIATALLLASPLVLAQSTSDTTKKKDETQKQTQTQPAQPATPAVPAVPGTGNQSGDPELNPPTTDEEGNTSTSGKAGRSSAGATGNPSRQSGKVAGGSDFGVLDANGDGSISKDELSANASLAGRFSEADKDSNGTLSRAEFASMNASPKAQSGAKANRGGTSSSTPGSTSDRTEGSDATSKDDELNKKVPGQ